MNPKKILDAKNSIVSLLAELLGNNDSNVSYYRDLFATMKDDEFIDYMKKLKNDELRLNIKMPNFNGNQISLPRCTELAEKHGLALFQRIWMPGINGSPTFLTPEKYLVVDLPVRRTSQLLSKKISVASGRSVDFYTKQPAGDAAAAKISYPEVQFLAAYGLEKTLAEMIKYRGGDAKGLAAFKAMINRYGSVTTEALEPFAGGVESTKTFKTYLTSIHISNNL